MSRLKIFKLIVQPTDNCLELLHYLNKNIEAVNNLGASVRIEKIGKDEFDDEMIETLRKKGITRLPALLAPDGKLFIGLKQVTDLFEKNLSNARNGDRVSPVADGYSGSATNAEMGSNPDLTNFWTQELYNGYDNRGKMIPRKDKDEADDEGEDIEKRLADYRRNVPRHRQTDTGRERDIDPAPRQRSRGRRDAEPDDNIADDEDTVTDDRGYNEGYDEPAPSRRGGGRAPRLPATGDSRGDDMDQRMLAAWMDNNSADS